MARELVRPDILGGAEIVGTSRLQEESGNDGNELIGEKMGENIG